MQKSQKQDIQYDDRGTRVIMCSVYGHQAFPIIFAYITKSQSIQRLLCMQCFKEDSVIEKKQLLELAKLQVDYGQNELRQHREDLKSQLDKYIYTLNSEKVINLDQLNALIQNYREEFLFTLQNTHNQLINAISHQVEFRVEMVTQNMQRQINIQVPEEIVQDILNHTLYSNEQMEDQLNEKFTTKGLVLYDRFNRQCQDLQRVDYMLNSRVTMDNDNIYQILQNIQEKVKSILAQVIIPDTQKHQQIDATQLFLPTTSFNIIQQVEQDNINVSKHQIINIFCKEDNWIEQFKQQLIDHDWFSQYGVKQIMTDWKNPIALELKPNQLDQYPTKNTQNKSQLVFLKCFNEKTKEEIPLQPIFDLLAKSQTNNDEKSENISVILSKDMLTTSIQIKKVLDNIKSSGYKMKNFCISLRSKEIDEKQLSLICMDLKNIIDQTKYLNIDLSINKLGDSCVQNLKPVLRASLNMRMLTLNFEQNGFGHHGCQQLSQCLMQLKTLVFLHLNLSSNKVTDMGCNNLASSIKNLNNLTHLGLSFNNNNVGEGGAKSLNNSISQLSNLTHLLIQMDNNHIGNKGFPTTFEYLGTLKNMISMSLSYKNNQLQSTCLQLLETMLSNYQNLDEFKLDLAQNNIGDQGLQNISQALVQKRFLKTLNLNVGNNSLTKLGIHSLGQALNQLGQLEDLSLNFEDNQLESNHLLSYGLKNKVKLKSLELQLKNLNNENGKVFQSIMDEGQQMIELQYLTLAMANNNLEDSNLDFLMMSLQQYQIIEDLRIDLSYTLLTNKSIQSLCKMLEQMKHLKSFEINLTGNKINDEGIQKLVSLLSKIKALVRLTLIFRNTLCKNLTFNQLKNHLVFIKDLKIYL